MDIHQILKMRRSVRAYDPRPIPETLLAKLLDAIRVAPSACNYQPWHFILVQDPDLRKQVAKACNGQSWVAQAPLIVVGCGLPEKAYKSMGGSGNSVDIDLAIALDHLTLAAAAEGLGSCWIGAFNESALKSILTIPTNVKIVALTPIGYPKSSDMIFPVSPDRRKKMNQIFSTDSFPSQ